MKQKNFSAKSASVIGRYARKEFTVFSECMRMVRRMFEAYEVNPEGLPEDLATAIAESLTAGVNPKTDLNLDFITKHLAGSQWVTDDKTILERIKGELVKVERWTPNKVITYVRRANRAQLDSLDIK